MDPIETVQIVSQSGGDSLIVTGGVVAALIYARQIAEVVAKLIPDSATGALGTVRRVAKLLACYTGNRS